MARRDATVPMKVKSRRESELRRHSTCSPMNDSAQYVEKIPESIGRYEIKACLGFGAMGAVYQAFDPLIKRTLAIKTIRLDIPRQSPQYKSFIERFYHEARISGTLSHPNIVTLYDIGEEAGVPFLAMEFADGKTISAMIEQGVRFAPERVVALISQIASALDYAHVKGVVHRDIKPSNLILCEGDRVKVTDFGIAKLADAELTQSGVLLGTPAYMSPEQAMGDKLDGRSDIFSLGICAFEMLSGEQPFPGNNVTAILYKVVHVEPVEPGNLEVLGLLPDKWREVFNRVLAKKPDDRYQTAAAFVQELEYCLGSWFGSAVGDETAVLVPSGEPIEQTEAMPAIPAAESGAIMEALATTGSAAPEPPATATPASDSAADVELLDDKDVEEATEVTAAPSPPAPDPDMTPIPTPPLEEEPTLLMPGVEAGEPETVVLPAAAAVDIEDDLEAPTQSIAPEGQPQTPTATPAQPPLYSMPTVVAPAPKPAPPSLPASRSTRAAAAPIKKPVVRSRPQPSAPAHVFPKRRSTVRFGKGWIAGSTTGAAIVLVVGGLLGLRILNANRNSSDSRPDQTVVATPVETQPAPSRGTLRVLSTPLGADVYVNGEARGTTPLVLTLPLGLYDVRISMSNLKPQSHKIDLSATQPMVELHARFSVRAMGSTTIITDPTGASVLIDGLKIGTTPIYAFKLDAGVHTVEIRMEGRQTITKRITVVADQRVELSYTLDPITASTPIPTFVDDERVYLPQEVDVRPRKLSGPHPDYPDARKLKAGESVSVTVTFVIKVDGSVADIEVAESGGAALDRAATSAVEQWRFEPGVKRGTPVKVRESRRFTFRSG
jgi:TonB family protein